MNRKLLQTYVSGEYRVLIAEAWFKLLGYSAATSLLHTAADKSGDISLAILKWLSYGLLFAWLSHKSDQLVWAHFPGADPLSRKQLTPKQMFFSGLLSLALLFTTSWLVGSVLKVLLKPNAV